MSKKARKQAQKQSELVESRLAKLNLDGELIVKNIMKSSTFPNEQIDLVSFIKQDQFSYLPIDRITLGKDDGGFYVVSWDNIPNLPEFPHSEQNTNRGALLASKTFPRIESKTSHYEERIASQFIVFDEKEKFYVFGLLCRKIPIAPAIQAFIARTEYHLTNLACSLFDIKIENWAYHLGLYIYSDGSIHFVYSMEVDNGAQIVLWSQDEFQEELPSKSIFDMLNKRQISANIFPPAFWTQVLSLNLGKNPIELIQDERLPLAFKFILLRESFHYIFKTIAKESGLLETFTKQIIEKRELLEKKKIAEERDSAKDFFLKLLA